MVSSVRFFFSLAGPGWYYITLPSGKAKARLADAHVGEFMTWSEVVLGGVTLTSIVSGAKSAHSQYKRISDIYGHLVMSVS